MIIELRGAQYDKLTAEWYIWVDGKRVWAADGLGQLVNKAPIFVSNKSRKGWVRRVVRFQPYRSPILEGYKVRWMGQSVWVCIPKFKELLGNTRTVWIRIGERHND